MEQVRPGQDKKALRVTTWTWFVFRQLTSELSLNVAFELNPVLCIPQPKQHCSATSKMCH